MEHKYAAVGQRNHVDPNILRTAIYDTSTLSSVWAVGNSSLIASTKRALLSLFADDDRRRRRRRRLQPDIASDVDIVIASISSGGIQASFVAHRLAAFGDTLTTVEAPWGTCRCTTIMCGKLQNQYSTSIRYTVHGQSSALLATLSICMQEPFTELRCATFHTS